MTENTPLLKQKCDAPPKSAIKIAVEAKEELPSVLDPDCEEPSLDIVEFLFQAWKQNGANEDLTPQEVMAMHLQYMQVAGKGKMLPARHIILSELAEAMFRCIIQEQNYSGYPFEIKNNIISSLRRNWWSIIKFDERLFQNLNAYQPPTCREQIRNAWRCTALRRFFSSLTYRLLLCQILFAAWQFFSLILLGWPLSLLIMGFLFKSECPMDSFLPIATMVIGLIGIVTFVCRLLLFSIEKWCFLTARTAIPSFWFVLKFVEFIFLLLLIILLWFFFGNFPSFDPKDPNFCNETFYSYLLWMKYISTAFAAIWTVTHFIKVVIWLRRLRYQYRPPFIDNADINIIDDADINILE